MKIWPFDPFAAKTQGNWISAEDLEAGLKPFQLIRDAVGNKMEIMCELHSLWSTPAALRICKALEPYDIFWAVPRPERLSAAAKLWPELSPSARCSRPAPLITPCWILAGAAA